MLKNRQLKFSFHSPLYDLIPENHVLRRINAVVDFTFANELFAESYCQFYGRPAKEPELMLRLLFLQFLYDLSDERTIEEAQVNLAYKWFLGLNPEDILPDPSVLSRFRTQRVAKNKESVDGILEAIVRQCVDQGLVKSSRLLVDATHVEADTKVQRPLDVLRAAAHKLVCRVRKHHPDKSSTLPRTPDTAELPAEEAGRVLVDHLTNLVQTVREQVPTLRGSVRDAVNRAERILADDKRLQNNGTSSAEDLDARFGRKSKTREFFGYKEHVGMVDGDEIITVCETTAGNADDGKQLPSVVEKHRTQVDEFTELAADAAYGSRANLTALAEQQVTAYIPANASVRTNGPDPRFMYNKDADEWVCPAGHVTYRKNRYTDSSRSGKPKGYIYFFRTKTCQACPLKSECYHGKHGKTITVMDRNPVQEEALIREQDPNSQTVYRRRQTIEHKFAELKRFCGMSRARYRSLLRVHLQAILACFVANAKRMAKLAAAV